MKVKLLLVSFASATVFVVVAYFALRNTLIHQMQVSPCGHNESCVRVCCPHTCENDTELQMMDIPYSENLIESYRIVKGPPCTELHPHENWTFTDTGHLIDEDDHEFNWNEYCYHHEIEMALTCPPISAIDDLKNIFPFLMISSVAFLVTTLIIYSLIRELRTLHGKCVMSYVVSLTIMYASLASVGLRNSEMLEDFNLTCRFVGYLIMASILMCFFWLNVMCYDTWSTIRSFTPKRDSNKKFVYYCVYAFGLPTLLVALVALLNETGVIPEHSSTGLGVHSCSVISDMLYGSTPDLDEWNDRRQSLYVYRPMMLILGVNFFFYVTTAHTIYRVQQDVKKFSRGERSRHARKESTRFALYARFFVMMGLPWFIEIISYQAGETLYLYLASIINCLQGFVIFVMFVLHKKVINLIFKRVQPQHSMRLQSTRMSKRSDLTRSYSDHQSAKTKVSLIESTRVSM